MPNQEILLKPKEGKSIRVNMQSLIIMAGSFSGVAIELKTILNYQQCDKARQNLRYF